MSRAGELSGLDRRHVWHPFTQAGTSPDPVVVREARGAVLYAEDGREFLDMISSWWVTLHGHAHPAIAEAVADQAARLEQVIFAGFTHAPAVRLAKRLATLLPGDLNRVFFSDDGSTAVEVALKLAHQYWRNTGNPERRRYLSFEGGYHGDTVGAMSAGSKSGLFDHWQDLMFKVTALPFPATWEGDLNVEEKEALSLHVLDACLDEMSGETAALIVEPLVQGAGGMRMCRPEFLRAVAGRIKDAGILLILDEVMTGFGRTGDMFACLKAEVTPDIICLSKGLTGGFLPMSVTVAADAVYDAFVGDALSKAFAHGHSFTANPSGCAAALASLDLLEKDETKERIKMIEAVHHRRLFSLPESPRLARHRVMGTIAAVDVECRDAGYAAEVGPILREFFMDRGLLIRPLGNVIYLLPPYCVSEDQLHRAYDAIAAAVVEVIK
ncbi:MAG: adenosylmethionine--8-amino-7-oxononanoate transaminase [Rhodospirillales bacterium RIFCSPLOWO2_12_FULL_58_28]|nr:MAG: adenosylmethionine--8-amino-7-oxononanoate transaminase [Rhodospirillales bacterium RIFCSPLOWO2_02_FULL_58_16]OHC78497.1 MAG: adenosylmethionine--8-amino-7-oxononanoate transaminase [Rhodospirillales bacterium RIFCSPLOWO2_12_FULL_58_28]